MDCAVDANTWWLAESISPINAAMLLSYRNPNTASIEEAESNTNDEMEPQDFRRLKNIFEGASQEPRTLKDWTMYARQRGLKIHSWINEWESWVHEVDRRNALIDGANSEPPMTDNQLKQSSLPPADGSGGVKSASNAPTWKLIPPPLRTPGYRWPLYEFLQAAHVAGRPCPKAQHVLDAWKLNPPERMNVIHKNRRDLLEYELENGNKKVADLKAIQATIGALIESE
jgi:hypothetical protein